MKRLKLKQIGSNCTELTYRNSVGEDITVFFSYETPVAGYDHKGAFRTDTKYSRTTSKHINGYVGPSARTVSQAYIEGLVA